MKSVELLKSIDLIVALQLYLIDDNIIMSNFFDNSIITHDPLNTPDRKNINYPLCPRESENSLNPILCSKCIYCQTKDGSKGNCLATFGAAINGDTIILNGTAYTVRDIANALKCYRKIVEEKISNNQK